MPDSAKVIRLEPEVQRQVRARLTRLPAAMHAVIDKGKQRLAGQLEAFFDGSDDALFDLADKAESNQEQNLFFDAMREVRVQRKSIETRFGQAIEEACAELVTDAKPLQTENAGELSAEALSLVQNDDLEQMVALESTINRANREFSQSISRLNKGIGTLVPVTVDDNNNPFAPAVICNAAMAQFRRIDIDIKAKLVLFKLFDRVVVGALPELFRELSEILIQNGIALADPANSAPPSSGSRSAGAPQATRSQPSHGQNPSSRHSSHEAMPGAGDASSGGHHDMGLMGEVVSAPDDNRSQLVELLSFMQRLPQRSSPERGMDIERALESVQRHKGEPPIEVGRVDRETMRLVQMLFDFMMKDFNLPVPMKELMGRLQVPLLKVALQDDDFLSNKGHAARRLLNEMSSVALGWQGKRGDESDPLWRIMQTIVERVIDQYTDNSDVFKDALADFSSYLEKEKRRAALLERRTIDAEDGKARAEMARRAVETEVQACTRGHELPRIVHELIQGPWSNVLFVTGLKYGFGSAEWVEHIKVLKDLVWSVQPSTNKAERQKLIRLIPDLIQRIRQGLDSISFNPFELTELLAGIEEVHLARIRGESLPGEMPMTNPQPQEVKPAPAEPKDTDESKPEKPAGPAAASPRQPLDFSGQTSDGVLPGDDPHMATVASFASGSWFELQDTVEGQETSVRFRLAAYIKPTGKYIFVDRSGMKVAEKSQSELAWALKRGKLRPLDNSMLFDRALESIVTTLRQNKNSMDINQTDPQKPKS